MSTPQEKFDELWNDFLEGDLEEAQLAELQLLFQQSPELLQQAADSYQLHRMLGVISSEKEEHQDLFTAQTMRRLPNASRFLQEVMGRISPTPSEKAIDRFKLGLLASAAMLFAVLAGTLWWARPSPAAPVVRISGVAGAFLWTGNGGQVVNNVSLGSELGGGTLEGMAPDSWAELEFLNDGSKVTISGKSLLTFSEYRQKELHLREGNMSAIVSPQPKGRPMLVHTRSASMEVLGTRFDVEAFLTSTALNVSQGKVKIKRLHDGNSVEVPANFRVVASGEHELSLNPLPEDVAHWRSDIPSGPDGFLGKWLPATKDEPARLSAVPLVIDLPTIKNLALYLAAIPISNGDRVPVKLEPNARFRVLGRLDAPTEVYFGIQMVDSKGRFAGKFNAHVMAQPDEVTGQFSLDLSTTEFELDASVVKIREELPESPEGYIVSSCWCCTLEQAKLEILEVVLNPQN